MASLNGSKKGLDFDFFGIGAGMGKPHQDAKNARSGLEKASTAFDTATAPELDQVDPRQVSARGATTTLAGPTAFNGITTDPSAVHAQQAQMAALANLAKNGGRTAASDANLAQIQQQAATSARGQRDAIMQNARARGMGGSGANLMAQLSSSQNAQNNASMQDMMVRGQDQNAALQAGMGAAQIGSGMQSQAFQEQAAKAQAADAIAKFNAGNQTQTSQFNTGQFNNMADSNANRDFQGQQFNSGLGQQDFANDMAIRGGKQGGGKVEADYWSNKYKEDQQANSALQQGVIKGIGSLLGASDGGRVPGTPKVEGDSPRNDTVPVQTSPGEVIVPRTLARSGNPEAIASFVQNPPPIDADSDKAAQISALQNLRKRR
jgi:hypothetical protein